MPIGDLPRNAFACRAAWKRNDQDGHVVWRECHDLAISCTGDLKWHMYPGDYTVASKLCLNEVRLQHLSVLNELLLIVVSLGDIDEKKNESV